MKVTSIILFLITVMGLGCEKHPLPIPTVDPIDTSNYVWHPPDSLGILPIVWYQKGYGVDTGFVSISCFGTIDGVITVNSQADIRNNCYLAKLDRQSGKYQWYWDGLVADHYSEVIRIPFQNKIYVENWSKIATIDLGNGMQIQNSIIPNGDGSISPRGDIVGNFVYKQNEYSQNPYTNDKVTLLRSNIDDGQKWEEVVSLYATDLNGFSPSIDNVALWIHPQTQDSILLFNCRMYHWYNKTNDIPGVERTDFKAFNLRTRKFEWSLDSICRNSSVVNSIIVIGNKAIFKCADSYIYSFDLMKKGEIDWKVSTIGSEQIMYLQDKNIVLDVENELKAINPIDGSILWHNNDEREGEVSYSEGYIYFIGKDNRLVVKNVVSGNNVFVSAQPIIMIPVDIGNLRFSTGAIAVDEENNLIYIADKLGTYCLRKPDKWE